MSSGNVQRRTGPAHFWPSLGNQAVTAMHVSAITGPRSGAVARRLSPRWLDSSTCRIGSGKH
jgi:hypothetical protein